MGGSINLFRRHVNFLSICIVQLNTMAKEKLVELFNFSASSKQTLVAPEMLQIVTADPFTSFLVQISKSRLETVPMRQVAFQLLASNQGVAKKLELVFLYFK